VKTEDKHLTRSALLVSVGLDWTLCFYYFWVWKTQAQPNTIIFRFRFSQIVCLVYTTSHEACLKVLHMAFHSLWNIPPTRNLRAPCRAGFINGIF
jgi:hypothetical protein